MIRIDARVLATCDGSDDSPTAALDLRERASVGIEGERIVYLGPTEHAPVADEVHEVGCVLPGFVDPHTHLVFGGSRVDEFRRRMGGEDYRTLAKEGGGIASTVRATRASSDDALFELGRARLSALSGFGVTSVEIKSGYGLDVETELRILRVARRLGTLGLARVTTSFLGAHALPPGETDRSRYVREVIEAQLPRVVAEGLADTVDVYCDEGAFSLQETRAILGAAKAAGLATRAHIGQFADLGGAELLAELGARSGDHLEQVDDAGLAAMAKAGVVGVFLPGAWRTLRQTPPEADRFRQAGVAMAIGTDLNPGTSPTANLPLMAALAVRDAGFTIEEAILGITRVAAQAAGFTEKESASGRLRVGGPADLCGFEISDPAALGYAFGDLRASVAMMAGSFATVASIPRLW
mgnify:CR=1 FL=1